MASALRLESVSCRYVQLRDRPAAIREVSLDILAGECVLISGPSGGGKTTVLRCMNGLVPHFFRAEYTGRTLIFGEETTRLSLPEIATRVGTVFQNSEAQLLTTTVEAEVAFGVENLGVAPAEGRARCEWAMRVAGVEHLRARLVSALSGGEKQRVVIASVLAMRPPILLFDEPLSNVDPLGARNFVVQLEALKAAGVTTVIVEQRARQFFGIADRLIWIEAHRVTHDGPIADHGPAALALGPIRPGRGWSPLPASAEGDAPDAEAPEARVDFERVSFRYPDGPDVLRDITLSLKPGQWVSVVGKNGIGKTTLAKLMNGLLRPTRGLVRVCGLETNRHTVRALSRVVGYVFQNPLHSLHAMTIEGEVGFYPTNQGWPRERVRRSVEASLGALGLHEHAAESPFVVSAGEQQRVSVAAVVAGGPRVLVLDEPTLGMSRTDLDRLLEMIGRVTAEGRLLITITHDLDLVRQSDRLVVLADGALYADGAPEAILTPDFIDAVFARA
jgi:energy-coupling factor transporter ATP-binding protein EcfA2